MTNQPEHVDDYEQALDDAQSCIRDIEELEWRFPIGDLIDYAQENAIPEAVIARLVDMASASSALVYEVPDAVWAFAKAAGMTDELTVREQEREAQHRAAIEDPNGLFQIMRRRHEE
jgi:hypothetical protein